MAQKYFYLITIQYLGYRFHGWQKQPDVKTLHLMVDRTLNFILEGKPFKSLSSGRTDAMVSAECAAFELFLTEPIEDQEETIKMFKKLHIPQFFKNNAIMFKNTITRDGCFIL